MANPSKLYFNEEFNPERAKYCTLILQLRAHDFSFVIIFQKKVLIYGKYFPLSELAEPREIDEYLLAEYHQVILAPAPEAYAIVPKALYNDDLLVNYTRFLDAEPTEKVYKNELDNENYVFFKDNDELMPLLRKRYKYHRIAFYYRGWIKAITDAGEPVWQNLYLDIQLQRVTVLYFKNGKLRFLNGFNFNNNDELIYFVALAANELHLSQSNMKLIISGDVGVGDKSIIALSEFFPRIEINKLQPAEKLPDDVDAQSVLSITALTLCGL